MPTTFLTYGGLFDLPRLTSELEEIEQEIAQPDFWKDAQAAAKVGRRKSTIEGHIERLTDLERQHGDLEALIELIGEGEDSDLQEELSNGLKEIEERIESWRLERLLSGEHDSNPAILNINPGAGGTESQDWAQMLMRMYVRWAEQRGYKVETIDLQPGDEAGIKSVTLGNHRSPCLWIPQS